MDLAPSLEKPLARAEREASGQVGDVPSQCLAATSLKKFWFWVFCLVLVILVLSETLTSY